MSKLDERDGTEAAGPAGELADAALALARSFAAGATLWCAAPEWPSHARHVAVEFVHPVIVGKRALPAAPVDAAEPAGSLRLLSRPGDVLLAISSADEPRAADLLRRAPAWGLGRLWLGAGPRPAPGNAEHTVWLDDPDAATAARSGRIVLLYHLLWELTHVVFEHPGLLTPEEGPAAEVCVTCRDQADVAEIQAVGGDGRLEVMMGGRPQTVDGSLLEPVAVGDLVMVHAGVALSRLPGGVLR